MFTTVERRLMKSNVKPLITFALFAYNQEKFIRAAIEGAFSQTYSPLEIILSDDCSTDETFKIIKNMANLYHGPHTIVLNQNTQNIGIGAHVQSVMELANGKLIVVAAGDDISMPTRTEVIFQVWEESGRHALSVFSSYINISADGREAGTGGKRSEVADSIRWKRLDGDLFEFLSSRTPMVNGCTAAWSPALITYFGSIKADLEDVVLSFRTLAIGQLLYINQPLVKYRRHLENVSFFPGEILQSFEHREKRLRWGNETTVKTYDNLIDDIKVLCKNKHVSIDEANSLQAEARRIQKPYLLEKQMMEGSISERLSIFATTALNGDISGALRVAPRIFPRLIYRAFYLLRIKWMHTLQVIAKCCF